MSLFQELRERRVFQFTSAYIVGGFGLIQFLEFLEGRMELSPNLVNLIGLAGVLLLPSVVLLAWALGRPGDDTLSRREKLAVPANVVVAAALLFVLFHGKELGAVTQTVEVRDENGALVEREVPRSEFRRRLALFYLDDPGDPDLDWTREGVPVLLTVDVGQDIFLDVALPLNMANALRDVGHPDGRDVPRPLMRRLATNGHFDHYCTGAVARADGVWRLTLELHDTDHGRVVAARDYEGADLLALVDEASRTLRLDLGIPEAHIDESPDLPVAELTSADVSALRGYAEGLALTLHRNDWQGAVAHLEAAVASDPDFTLAHFMLFGVYQTVGRAEDSEAAMAAAMRNLYLVTERTSFLIKSQHYFNIEQDMDKAMAVLGMWTRLYPTDVEALSIKALYHFIRQELEESVATYRTILEIDPSQYRFMEEIADLQRRLGRLDEAEATLQAYVERFPGRADGYADLSDFYADTGRLDEAREALDQARLLEPGDLDLTLGVVDLDLKLGRYDDCGAVLAEALDRTSGGRDHAKIHARRLNIARLRGRGDELIEALDAFYAGMAEVQNPLQLDLVWSMTLPVLCEVGRPDAAIVRLDAAATRIPEPFDGLTGVGRAWALAVLARPEEARAELDRAVAVVEQYSFETFRSSLDLVEGMIAEAENDPAAAVPAYRRAYDGMIQVDPMYHVRLAAALRRQGDTGEARRILEAGLALHPAHPEANLEMALVRFDDGRRDEARTHLDAALAAWDGADADYPPSAVAADLAARLESTP